MVEKKPSGKILVRGIPDHVMQALTSLAVSRERSVEAEVRRAIVALVEPQLQNDLRTARAKVVGQRIRYLFDELGDLYPSSSPGPIAPSKVADAIGWSHAEPIESWMSGEIEPSFKELSAIAKVTGCEYDWIAHGDGVPFLSAYYRLDRSVRDAVLWLIGPVDAREPSPRQVMIVRNESESGELAFVKRFSDWRAQVYTTPYHVSGVTGNSGKADLAWLALTLQRLCRSDLPFNVSISGYQAGAASFNELTEGRRHPMNVMRNRDVEKSTWWEDIWDPSMIETSREYWPGWRDLIESIHSTIECSSTLKAERGAMQALRFLDPKDDNEV